MRIVKRLWAHLDLVMLLQTLSTLVWYGKYSHHAGVIAVYESWPLGTSEAKVEEVIGPSDEVLSCTDRQANDDARVHGPCVTWTRYNFTLYAVGLGYSADGRLV